MVREGLDAGPVAKDASGLHEIWRRQG